MRISTLSFLSCVVLFTFGCSQKISAPAPKLAAAAADEAAFLDAPYRHPRPTIRNAPAVLAFVATDAASDTESVIQKMTPVKSQASRGTCAIFSATGLLEAMLVIHGDFPNTVDLSEEWLEYVATRYHSTDGSSSYSNFGEYLKYGAVEEALLPYIGVTWTEAPSDESELRCGKIADKSTQTSCLIGHRHPGLLEATEAELTNPESELFDQDFVKIRAEATKFKEEHMGAFAKGSSYFVPDTAEVKKLLRAGIPLTVDLDFFYGAWNHRLAPQIGAERDMDHWEHGLVGYPEPGSKDREHSSEKPAGHSVIVVGYDDRVTFVTHVLMEDGTYKDFSYTGVYYFKNSWGTTSFGKDFNLDGVGHPGYGAISQKYAEEFGTFYRLPLATSP